MFSMSAKNLLRSSERSALNNTQFVSHVVGKKLKGKNSSKNKSWGSIGFILTIIILGVVIFGAGNIIPTTIYEKLLDETDVQCADMMMSKNLAFQQALQSGNIPDDTTKILKEKGILVGYINNDGDFVENNKSGTVSVLKVGDEIVEASNFMEKVTNNASIYSSINDATYGCAAAYYDEAAKEVFDEIGTSRNNFTDDSDLEETMNSLMGSGSDINANSVYMVERTRENPETKETEVYYEYIINGETASSKAKAADFIKEVGDKSSASSSDEATLNSADTLKVADTISKEQRSSLFFSLFMENVSKMKSGDGDTAKVNDVMNYLYDKTENEIVDVKTGETVKVVGTAMDSPSLYAILSDKKVDASEVENYSSDRILKTIENRVGRSGDLSIKSTVASTKDKTQGSIGRFISDGVEAASNALLSLVEPTVNRSLVNNSYNDTKGINAGETLVEGAVNVGKKLAKKSGATSGDAAAVLSYNQLNTKIAKLNAEVDRLNRSPFDITSRNTFLGSIVYDLATISMRFSGALSGIKVLSNVVGSAISSLLPVSYADSSNKYLATFGDCETYATIGAVGTAQCSEIAVFDTSTLNDPFNDAGFIDFVNNNTILDSSGVRKIKEGSDLANFILYNDERQTPLGVMDGGIIGSINSGSDSISFMSDILDMVETFLGASDQSKRFATGEAFVNSSTNSDWQTYKYAQRYVSLARATTILKQYSNDNTAYNSIKFFEGDENPVMAFIKNQNIVSKK